MPNIRYFAGNSLAAFKRSGTGVVESTGAGTFNATYVSNCISTGAAGGYIQTPNFAANPASLWIRFDHYYNGTAGGAAGTYLGLVLGPSGGNLFQIARVNNGGTTMQPQYWNGSAWVNTGAAIGVPGGLNTYVVRIDLNSGFELFINGISQTTGTGWTGSPVTATALLLMGTSNTQLSQFSEVMVANYDLRSSHLFAKVPNGASAANTGQSAGTYADVNETVMSEANILTISASGNKAGQTKAAIAVPNGFKIAAMVVCARGLVSGAITDGKLGIRSGGANYSSTGRGFVAGYEPRIYIADNDPATGVEWTQTGFNNAEIYEEAV